MSPELESITRGAEWHLYDFGADEPRLRFLRLAEADYRSASFLDERSAPPGSRMQSASVAELEEALRGTAHALPPPRFIFHLGHCGSTLLSRALATTPAVLPLREPLTLRRLAALLGAEKRSPQFSGLLELTLSAHARVFAPHQHVMVKATSTCNSLLIPILEARPESRAVLMYVSLETYLAGMLGKETPAADLAGHAATRFADWNAIPGTPVVPEGKAAEHDLVELAVLAWLTGMRHLVAAAEEFSSRTQFLDFEEFLSEPRARIASTAEFLGLGREVPKMLEAWPDISTSYSKQPDRAYSAFNRRKTLQRARLTRSAEILAGLNWAETLISCVDALRPCGRYLYGP